MPGDRGARTDSRQQRALQQPWGQGADTKKDLIIDLSTKGIVFKDEQNPPRYWRVTINTAGTGAIVTTDLGTTKPGTV